MTESPLAQTGEVSGFSHGDWGSRVRTVSGVGGGRGGGVVEYQVVCVKHRSDISCRIRNFVSECVVWQTAWLHKCEIAAFSLGNLANIDYGLKLLRYDIKDKIEFKL